MKFKTWHAILLIRLSRLLAFVKNTGQNFKKEEVCMHVLSVHLLKNIHTNNLAVKEESTNKNNKGNVKGTDNQVAEINHKESFLLCCRQKMNSVIEIHKHSVT